MSKLDNFSACLRVLQGTDFGRAVNDEIYRSGIAHQFSLTFELAWKCLKQYMQDNDVIAAQTGSTVDIIKLAYQVGLIDDFPLWRQMSRDRNITNHVYNADEVDLLIAHVKNEYLPALKKLQTDLTIKYQEIEKSFFPPVKHEDD
ncbi:nucleotidyltransferase substrate binding protein [bacterium]|nr:nucleotidyltransferase substrate binding protein [bacterium]